VVDASIKQHCETVRVRLNKCNNFDAKRKFVLDYIEKIVYSDDHITVHGSVPVKLKAYENSELAEASKLEFKIRDRISAAERLGRNNTNIG
jgi:hypothetical protein